MLSVCQKLTLRFRRAIRRQNTRTRFFCLLEDDNLVTGLSVTTDRLLDLDRVTGSTHTGSEVLLLIHVETKRTIYAV